MQEDTLKELKNDVRALHKKLDTYHEQTIQNTTDVAWLKRGMFGSIFTYIGAIIYTKLGG